MNLRVSVTAVDSWLFVMRHEDSDVNELMAQLRGETPQNEAMRVGSAFHKAMELAEPGETFSLKAKGYVFTVMPQIEVEISEIKELKLEQEIPIDKDLTVTLVGKVDGFERATVTDYKSTKRYEAEYLLDTYQWKQYLVMTNGRRFVWKVFVLDEGRLSEGLNGQEWEYQVKDYHQLEQYRYPGIEADCLATLREFLSFLNVKNLRWPSQDCTLANLLKANQ